MRLFAPSTDQYKLLVELVPKTEKCLVPKSLSETRWSWRANAVKAIVLGYGSHKSVLEKISKYIEQKGIFRVEAHGILNKLCTLETSIYSLFWNDILDRFDATNKSLQNPKLVLQDAVPIMKSLKVFVASKEDKFDKYEIEAKQNKKTKHRNMCKRIMLGVEMLG